MATLATIEAMRRPFLAKHSPLPPPEYVPLATHIPARNLATIKLTHYPRPEMISPPSAASETLTGELRAIRPGRVRHARM
jgi:hypothetical protein